MQQIGDHVFIECVETDSISAAKMNSLVVWKSYCKGH